MLSIYYFECDDTGLYWVHENETIFQPNFFKGNDVLGIEKGHMIETFAIKAVVLSGKFCLSSLIECTGFF